jgi:hypothetical protein
VVASDALFKELPKQGKPNAEAAVGEPPRLREPERDQIELRAVDIDSLLGEDHPARVIWSYVAGLDLRELEDRIKSTGRPARPSGHFATAFAGAVAVRHKRWCRQRARPGTAVR